jgi:hypothetical protein
MIASGDVRHHVVEHEYPQTLFIKLEWSFLLLLTGNSTLSLKIVPRKDGLLSSLAYDVYLGLLTGQTTFLLTGSTVIPKVATDSEYDLTLGVESGASIRRMRAHILITGWRGRAPYYGAPSDLPEPNTTVTDIYGGGWVAGTAYIVSTTVTSTIGSIAGARTTLFLYNSSGALLWYSSEREAPTNAGASYQCSWSMVALDPGTYEFKISVVRDPPAHGITRYCGQFVVRAASDPPLIKA